ncbi:MAG: ethanolamine ammonia-lyase subunit EutC [Pseudomonadota bacterium]
MKPRETWGTPREAKRLDIKNITDARLTLSAPGQAVDTATALTFALDHARAREAVLSEFDLKELRATLSRLGFEHRTVTSAAEARDTYIRRPDLGRVLPQATSDELSAIAPCDVALVLGDGLSASAAMLNGPAFFAALAARLAARGLNVGPVIVARQARVALGDGIATALDAQTVVMALGERPGLSAADSLGVYITHKPHPGTADSERNCISNVREAGLSIEAAAEQAEHLIMAMRRTGQSGVALSSSLAVSAGAGALASSQDDDLAG